jgi:hypothetical protein
LGGRAYSRADLGLPASGYALLVQQIRRARLRPSRDKQGSTINLAESALLVPISFPKEGETSATQPPIHCMIRRGVWWRRLPKTPAAHRGMWGMSLLTVCEAACGRARPPQG